MTNQDRQAMLILATLKDAKETILTRKPWFPLAVLSSEKGFCFIKAEPEVVNDEELRTDFFQVLRAKADEVEADIVIFAINIWEHHQTEAQLEEERGYIAMNNGKYIDVEMKKALGLSDPRECILLLIETPKKSFTVRQYYKTSGQTVEFLQEEISELKPRMKIFPSEVKI